MFKRFLVVAVLLAALVMMGCGQAGPKVTKVGEAITVAEATPLEKLMTNPAELVGETIVVEGHVTGRCMGSGCWVSIDTGDPEKPFYAKSADHTFVFPEACVDKDVRVQGVLMVMQPKAEKEAEHDDHEHKHDHEQVEGEEDAHVCPAPIYYLDPKGAEIKA